MPERGGGEGGGGKHAPRQAVLLRGVVGLLNPAPGTNLMLKGITNLINSSKKSSIPSVDDKQTYKPPGGRS